MDRVIVIYDYGHARYCGNDKFCRWRFELAEENINHGRQPLGNMTIGAFWFDASGELVAKKVMEKP